MLPLELLVSVMTRHGVPKGTRNAYAPARQIRHLLKIFIVRS
jgi:hypothetical protein